MTLSHHAAVSRQENFFIATAVEKKHLLLFNKCGDDSPHRPQNGLAVDFIVSTGGLPVSGSAAV